MDKDNEVFIQDDNYRLFVPIEDHDLLKSVSVDENGDYIVQGVMTSDDKDEEDDSIDPEGMDCSYFLEKGWIKYEHGNRPEQFIGEPIEVKVGRFEHPTLKKSVNGIYVKGRLFAHRELAKQAVKTIQDLQKSNTKRRMGWSIEGSVKERDRKTGKIIKSVLRNVVLTMNPVNTTTWAELAKSFAKNHELTIDMDEPMEKAMDIQGAQAITKQSLEGNQEKDPQQEWIDLFREMVRKALIEKSFQREFVTSAEDAELLAFSEALSKGLDYDEAEAFASYIAEKHDILKSLVTNFGGETMSQEAKNKLASLLDTDLEELKKSLEMEDEDFEDDEELEKSMDEEDEYVEEDEDEGDDEDEDEDDEDDEDMEKSFKTDLSKSLAENGHQKAFEVSDFLADLTDELGFALSGLEKSMTNVTKQQNAIIKAITTMGDMMKSFQEEIAQLREENEELNKSLSEVMNRPVGRKGVVSQREVQTLSKSMGATQPKRLTRSQIIDELVKSFEAGEIPGSTITRFEAGTPLTQLNLPEHLQKSFGLI